jgi:hypothetical protein
MKTLTSTAIVAIVAGTIGFVALTPVAFAQQGPEPGGQQPGQQFGHHMQNPGQFGQFGNQRIERMRNARGPEGRGGLLQLVCSDEGAERAEIGFVRLGYRLELTPEQQTLFDDLKTATLTAQTQFADQCAKPAEPTSAEAQPTVPNPVERLTAQIGNDSLRLELMQGLLPKLEAFYGSLTDEQKASLQPQRDGRDGRGFRNRRGELPVQPGQPDAAAPEAPAVEPTAALIG